MLFGFTHGRFEAVLGEVALPGSTAEHVRRFGHGHGFTQAGDELVDAGDGVGIGGRQVSFQPAVGQHQEPVPDVVEDHQIVGQQEDESRQVQFVGGRLRQLFDEAHPVVGQVAHGAADKAWQAGHVDG